MERVFEQIQKYGAKQNVIFDIKSVIDRDKTDGAL